MARKKVEKFVPRQGGGGGGEGGRPVLEKNSRQEEFSKVDVRERKSSCCERVSIKLRLPLAYRLANSIKNYENFLLDSKVSRNPFYNPFSFSTNEKKPPPFI